jgi:hypothetical protein
VLRDLNLNKGSIKNTYHNKLFSICISSENYSLYVSSIDELSAFRLKKNWNQVISQTLFLEFNTDYLIKVTRNDHFEYVTTLSFLTPNGKFNFWKISSGRAQSLIYKLHSCLLDLSYSKNKKIRVKTLKLELIKSISKYINLAFTTK